jgi:anthranilate/para-aminobenzoate synthase component I
LTGKIIFLKLNNYYNLEILLPINFQEGEGFSNLTDEEFKHNVALAHCFRGDVFQLVLSRRFTLQRRRVQCVQSVEKHQPFLIYSFDYGDFKIFGSSPEAQIIVKTVKPKSILLQELLKEQVMMKRRNTSQRIIRR